MPKAVLGVPIVCVVDAFPEKRRRAVPIADEKGVALGGNRQAPYLPLLVSPLCRSASDAARRAWMPLTLRFADKEYECSLLFFEPRPSAGATFCLIPGIGFILAKPSLACSPAAA
jgi:hypothetical protein